MYDGGWALSDTAVLLMHSPFSGHQEHSECSIQLPHDDEAFPRLQTELEGAQTTEGTSSNCSKEDRVHLMAQQVAQY